MKPSARIQGVLDLLDRIAASRVPMDSACGDYFRGRTYIGSKDRADIAERVYAITRAQARLGWILRHYGFEDTPRHRLLAWLAMGEGKDARYIDGLFDGGKYSPGELSDTERAALAAFEGKTLSHPDMPEAVRVECPPQHEETLRGLFGDAFVPEMEAMLSSAPLDLRANVRHTGRDALLESLEKDGVPADRTPWSPWGLRARGKAFLSKTKAFHKGYVEIQDEGSQLIAYVCGAKPGMQVLDYCAGGGGKTLALAGAMQVKGRIVAMDLDARRLEKARPRFRKAGVHDIIEVRPLSDEKNRKWLRRQKGTFDIALLDVPCSGSGTWRRNPDTRWRHYGPDLAELLAVQADILTRVAHTLKPGGRLVYATCSLLPQENERQVEAFLAANPDFSILPLAQAWPEGKAPCDGDFLRLSPHRHNTDGFFAACLRRNG